MRTTRLAGISISGLLLISSFGTGSGHAQEPIRPAEQAKPSEPEPLVVKGARMEFVAIPPGEFTMGCSPGDSKCDDDEKPSHRVRITQGFEMGKYEVTQAQWEAVMEDNPSDFKGADRPVERVNWNDIQGFLGKLNARNDGYRYRLPTEAEWEYAARAGSTAAGYGKLDDIAWYADNSGGSKLDSARILQEGLNVYLKRLIENGNQTHPVAQKAPNEFGLYDTMGNVWEWCHDWYDQDYYGRRLAVDPRGPSKGKLRVLRGGCWYFTARNLRASDRLRGSPGGSNRTLGFRCARERK